MSNRNTTILVSVMLVLLVAIFSFSMIMGAGSGTGDEPFAGTDSLAEEAAKESGSEPWFEPIFEPGSGEIESGLFALQAAIGAGILGFALGRLGREHKERPVAAPETVTPEPETS